MTANQFLLKVINSSEIGVQLMCNSGKVVEDLIYSWAPLIYLHSEEEFFPSSVEFYLPEVTIQDENGVTVQENVTPDSILGGDNSFNHSVSYMINPNSVSHPFNQQATALHPCICRLERP